MTIKISGLVFLLISATTSSVAFANADDMKWVGQCLVDNKDEGESSEVVKKYCECMNDKMSDEETKTITQWEKDHPKEEKECSDKAGWKK